MDRSKTADLAKGGGFFFARRNIVPRYGLFKHIYSSNNGRIGAVGQRTVAPCGPSATSMQERRVLSGLLSEILEA